MSTDLERQPVETEQLPGALTTMGYSPPRGMDFAEWERVVTTLLTMHRTIGWWLGDALNFGEDNFGEDYAQVIEVGAGSFEASTLSNFMRVARCVPYPRRREQLSFSHHAEVAALPSDTADQLLEQAVREGWTSRELRVARKGRAPESRTPWTFDREKARSALEVLGKALANEPTFADEEREDMARGLHDAREVLIEYGWPAGDTDSWVLAQQVAGVGIRALAERES